MMTAKADTFPLPRRNAIPRFAAPPQNILISVKMFTLTFSLETAY